MVERIPARFRGKRWVQGLLGWSASLNAEFMALPRESNLDGSPRRRCATSARVGRIHFDGWTVALD